MVRYWSLVIVLLLMFLGIFILVEQLQLMPLIQPQQFMTAYGIGSALVGVGLLIVDVILPIPASLVMVTHGALFGIVLGTSLSLVGSLGAAMAGFAIGRRGGPLLAHFVSPAERARTDRLLAQWGMLAIILTRPVPLLAETTAVMAGVSPMGWRPMILASLAGTLPSATLYAITGATAIALDSAWLTIGLVLVVAGVFWVLGRHSHMDTPAPDLQQ